MQIWLIRHGRTAANATGVLQGRVDNPLDELGRRQAAAIAEVVRPVEQVIASPLRRAVDTARALGVEPTIDERWSELDYGRYDGRPVGDVPAVEWARWRADLDHRPPDGETLRELGVRVRDALEELAATPGADRIVVVSHVSPIKAAVAWALGVDDSLAWRCRLDPASITRLSVGAAGPSLLGFNDIAHLRSVA